MLPDFLTNSYKQYKADTNAVATWLVNTAKKCGLPDDVLTPPAVAPQAPVKYVLTKKQKKRMQSAQKTSQLSKSKYVITTGNFISLASFIAGCTKFPVTVSDSLAAALDRAISVRKVHQAIHQAVQKHDISGSEAATHQTDAMERHSHFVGILEEVRIILRPKMSVGAQELTKASVQLAAERGGKTVVNMFESLNLEEPSEEFLSASVDAPISTSKETQYEVEPIRELSEVYLAIHCLFQDLTKLRNFITQTWGGYRVGAVDLVTASIATNTAVDFARRIGDDFIKSFPEYSNPREISGIFFVAQCVTAGEDPSYRERPGDTINFRVYDIADACLLTTEAILTSFAEGLHVNYLPVMKPGYFGDYEAASEWTDISPRKKLQDDKVALAEALPEFVVIARGTDSSILGEDEFTRALRPFIKTKKTTLWLVFAAQVYLDIHHVLRNGADRAFQEMRNVGQNIKESINENFKFHENLKSVNWPKANDRTMESILKRIDMWVMTDVIERAKREMGVGEDMMTEPFFFLKRHPLLCGLITYSLKMLFTDIATIFVNAWGSFMHTAHIYNAARQEKFCDNEWIDMELAIYIYGPEKFFVGKRPENIEDYFKHHCLCMGSSAINFVTNGRKNIRGATDSQKGPRSLGKLAPICRMYMDRFCTTGRVVRVDLTEDDVRRILERAAEDKEGGGGKEFKASKILDQDALPRELSEAPVIEYPQTHSTRIRQLWEKEHRCTPVQLLESLRNAILNEQLELTFDQLELHRTCWRLLRTINEGLHENFVKIIGAGYMEEECQLPLMAGYIFGVATNTKKDAGLVMEKTNDVGSSKLLMQASKVVEAMIDSGAGNVCVKILRKYHGMTVEFET